MKFGIKTAVLAGGLLTALYAAGCGASAGGAGSVRPVTVQGGPGGPVPELPDHRARSRGQLTAGQPSLVGIQRAGFAPPGGRDLAMDTAALVAWLITAGSGSHVLVTWTSRGGSMRPGAGAAGSPPTVIFGHFGLALAGLVIWVTYLVAGWTALAWTAVGVLLPVAGLGMATVTIGLPSRSPAVATSGAIPAAGNIRSRGGSTGPVPPRRRLSPLIVIGHGLLAVTTMALVLLAALGPAAT